MSTFSPRASKTLLQPTSLISVSANFTAPFLFVNVVAVAVSNSTKSTYVSGKWVYSGPFPSLSFKYVHCI